MVYIVYHGTQMKNLESIERDGLRPAYHEAPTVTTYWGAAGLYAVGWAEGHRDGVVIEYHIPDELVDEYLYLAEPMTLSIGEAWHRLRKKLPSKFIAKKYRVSPDPPALSPLRREPEVRVRGHRRKA